MIKIRNVSKVFSIPHEKRDTLKDKFVNIFNKTEYEEFYALQDINLQIKKGEFVGIIGLNGAGKSVLLKIIAGILHPDRGHVRVNGKISPFLELGVGFQLELTAKENIYLYGAVLGLSKKEIREKFDKIIKFADLEKFIDTKLKNFSSGMQARLGFSTAIQAGAEILLVDEVLAVGDVDFQKKCFKVFNRFKKEGKTMVFVSHNLGAVEKFCNRCIFLESGKIIADGNTKKVIKKYLEREKNE
ncbi:ABC transporter ATP-binding protein [Candidatus Woesearchaeota archaeon]|nr:ABC transporter ATP-binding protein [Candidatus Woesearchaeota archaeon]